MSLNQVNLILGAASVTAVLGPLGHAAGQDTHHRMMRGWPQPFAGDAQTGTITPKLKLHGLQATLTQMSATIGANDDGTDLWPCFGLTPGPNLDCPTVGNPTVGLPQGGIVVGYPSYIWWLQNTQNGGRGNASGWGCDALINGTTGTTKTTYMPCTQIATWYEDNTNDSTDDLLQRILVTQGSRIIYDSGVVDYGPAGPTVSYPVDVILNTDANFGYWPGTAAGPNNGNCSPDVNYPLTSPAFPNKPYVVESNQTCQEPVHGPAKFHTTTTLATPTYTKRVGAVCTANGVASPCYTVSWSKKDGITQDFEVFLE